MGLTAAAFTLALMVGAPSAPAACSCAQVVPAGETQREWFDRPRVFIGHVLLVDGTRPSKVLFVTESSWRGPMADTVTLAVRAPCAHYIAGGRYLVVADVDDAGRLVTAPCDYSWSIPVAPEMMAQLGAPNWIPAPFGLRSLDRTAIRLGSRGAPASDSLVFAVPWDPDIQRFELADWAGQAGPQGRLLYLTAGLYQFRVTWKDGMRYESYLWLRCDSADMSLRPCHSFRFLRRLR
jgi:hypothetical protein